tara:strand:+ start:15810 stop:16109 length:300 start_codon:yes stop_codon:yes gene_type:complete
MNVKVCVEFNNGANMINKTVTKLWQGKYTSVRDYEIAKAIRKGGLIIYYKDKHMTIDVDELKKLKATGKVIQSKYKGSYRLVDILFKPETDDKNQYSLL